MESKLYIRLSNDQKLINGEIITFALSTTQPSNHSSVASRSCLTRANLEAVNQQLRNTELSEGRGQGLQEGFTRGTSYTRPASRGAWADESSYVFL